MDLKKINEKLTELFSRHRIVFWNDVNADFENELSECLPPGIDVIRPNDVGQFKTKITIEIDKPEGKFLVYSVSSEPRAQDDWLLDIRLYSYQFRADTASMIVEELGLQHLHLRDHIAKRIKFFYSKQRFAKLKVIISSGDLEMEIDRKLLAVIAKAENDRFFDVIHAVYDSFPFDDGLNAIPEEFAALEKMNMADVFWAFAKESFGYEAENPTLRHLLTCLFISDLYSSIGDHLCQNVRQFILPSGFSRNAAVCMSEWRDNVKMTESYDRLSEMVSDALRMEQHLKEIPLITPEDINSLKDTVTFSVTERISAGAVKIYILEHEATIDKDFVIQFCRRRQALHWSNKRLSNETVPRDSYWAVYESLIAIAEFMAKKQMFPQGFTFKTARDVFEAYTRELYIFDRYYRLFYENASIASARGWDILKDLKSRVEDLYNNWFLEPLTMLWEDKIKSDRWYIDGIINQFNFYGNYPEPKTGDKNTTVFVIISDALRYECAAEMTEMLNGKYRFTAKIEGMLGVVPSYTALGMSSLLPHLKLAFSPKGDVLVDGKMSSSIAQRDELLSGHKGLAIKGAELMRKTREDAREIVREKNVVYLYHNAIDAIGDDAKTEDKTFSAVRNAVDEIGDMVSFVVNNLNARHIFITADHGFVYTDDRPGETERNKGALSDKEFVILKKRYALGKSIPTMDYVHQGKVSTTAGTTADEDMDFATPKGMSLFYFSGGSRYFHGGLSLQEVVIPVVAVEQVRGKEKVKTRDRYVGVQVLGQDHRVTTGRHRFEILQLESVSERIRPVSLKIGVYSENEPVTDIQTVTFESTSQEMADRRKEVVLTLKNIDFATGKKFQLILRNAATDIEIQSIPVRIDRAFTVDF